MRSIIISVVVVGSLILMMLGFYWWYLKKLDVTQDEFDRLEEGMTYGEVTSILGKRGTQTQRIEHYVFLSFADSYYDFLDQDNYVWVNLDKSGIMLTFDENKKLVDKNLSRLDMPGIMNLAIELDDGGNVENRDAIEALLGDETDFYINLYREARNEEPPPPPPEKEQQKNQDEQAQQDEAAVENLVIE